MLVRSPLVIASVLLVAAVVQRQVATSESATDDVSPSPRSDDMTRRDRRPSTTTLFQPRDKSSRAPTAESRDRGAPEKLSTPSSTTESVDTILSSSTVARKYENGSRIHYDDDIMSSTAAELQVSNSPTAASATSPDTDVFLNTKSSSALVWFTISSF